MGYSTVSQNLVKMMACKMMACAGHLRGLAPGLDAGKIEFQRSQQQQ
jgi:hypothetical protein